MPDILSLWTFDIVLIREWTHPALEFRIKALCLDLRHRVCMQPDPPQVPQAAQLEDLPIGHMRGQVTMFR